MSYRRVLMLVPLLAAAPLVHAETLYVIEQLVVNVNSAPDSTGERVTTIKSGAAAEVLETQGDQVHVHLANGTEGWVRKSYLSAEEPLQLRLSERNAEIEKLKQDVARFEGELATARKPPAHDKPGAPQINMSANPTASGAPAPDPVTKSGSNAAAGSGAVANSAPPATASAGADNAADPVPGEPSYFMTPPEEPARPVWHWALGSFVIALGLGFVLGWQVLDRRIRRKYGGLRIY